MQMSAKAKKERVRNMSVTLRMMILIGIIFYFAFIFYCLKKRALALKYTLLWIAGGFIVLLIDIFPQLLMLLVVVLGVELPVNGIFAICIFFMILLLISITSIVSKQTDKIYHLTQYVAALEKRVREIEEQQRKE